MMERFYSESVFSVVDSTHSTKSTELLPSPPIRTPSLAPILRPRELTDFSINKILGLENDEIHKESICSAPVLCRHPSQTPSPQHSFSDTSPRLSPSSDNASSASDYDSGPHQVSTHSEQPPRKKRQRTTFSPLEVWELERAYSRQPYLLTKDEEDLVQRLGITAKSLKYWFQNRRAKSRKEEEHMTSRNQSSSSNQFGLPVRRGMLSERHQTPAESFRDQWKHAECVQTFYPGLENNLKVLPHSPPIRADNHYSSVKSNQLRSRSSVQASMLHPDQFERRLVEPARVLFSGKYHHHRYHPY